MSPSLYRRAAILFVIAIAARALTFGNPIVHVDEEFYFVTARAMLDGALPYVDVWDRKPIGLFLLYLPAAALGYPAGIWAYQAMALLFVAATALGVARLADRAGWQRGAVLSGVAYILWLNFADGQGGQAPIFYNLPMVIAALLIAPDAGHDDAGVRMRRGLGAMALVGCAMQVKYTAVFEGAFFGLWWMWHDRHAANTRARTILRAVPLVLVALLPTTLAWGWYAAQGHAAAFTMANFTSIFARRSDPAHDLLRNLAWLALMMLPLLVVAAMSRRETAVARFVAAWLVVALGGVALFGSWFNHYALPLMLPAAVCAGGWLGTHRRAAVTWLCIAFLTGQFLIVKKRNRRGDATQYSQLVAAVGPGPGTLFVYSGSPMLYVATGRRPLSPWLFPTHLHLKREQGSIGVDQASEVRRILAARPDRVVVSKQFGNERADVHDIVMAELARTYRQTATVRVGKDPVAVYTLAD